MYGAGADLIAFSLSLLASVSAAGAMPFQCPEAYAGDGGSPLRLVERPSGVWRVNDPVPFVWGKGRFWRFVCAYRGDGEAPELESVVHWVGEPHEDGRLIVEDVCHDGPAADGTLRSVVRQAKVRISLPDSAAGQRLARDMLAAAETVAVPCPGSSESPKICSQWKVTEIYQGDSRRECTWRQGASSESGSDDEFRYLYRSECLFRGFVTSGSVKRTGRGEFERSIRSRDGRLVRYVYQGDFEGGGLVKGTVHWRSPEGDRSPDISFEARCVSED